MSDEPTDGVPQHTPEEQAEFDARASEIAGYANLLTDYEQGLIDEENAEKEQATAQAVSEFDATSRIDRIEERHAPSLGWIGWMIGLVLLVLFVAVVAFYTGGRDGGSDEAAQSQAAESADVPATGDAPGAVADAEETANDGAVAGTWILYSDDTKAYALYRLTFQPDGAIECLMAIDPPVEYQVDDWSFSQEGDIVEIVIEQRIVDGRYGVNERSDAWFHLTLADGAMTGTWEQDRFGYETVGETAGTVYRSGVAEVQTAVYAEPAPSSP